MVDMLRELGAAHIRVVVGGGGTISPDEIAELEALRRREDLHARGRPPPRPHRHDRRRVRARRAASARRCESALCPRCAITAPSRTPSPCSKADLRQATSGGSAADDLRRTVERQRRYATAPVVGLTGTGGAGKSSLTDELLQRFLRAVPRAQRRGGRGRSHAAPLRRRAAGRPHPHEFAARSPTCSCVRWPRAASTWRPARCSRTCIALYRAAGFDLVVVETAGIGQSDTEIVDLADLSLYVMTASTARPASSRRSTCSTSPT